MTSPSDSRAAIPAVASFVLDDEAATQRLGDVLADAIAIGSEDGVPAHGFSIHLSGELGAGKTTLVRALLRRLGVTGRIKSPTYALVEPYPDVQLDARVGESATSRVESRQRMKLDCYHFDFYRLEVPHEWIDAGFREIFDEAALRLVEWPERASSESAALPAPDWHVALATIDGIAGRRARIEAHTARGAAWLRHVDGSRVEDDVAS